MSCACLVYLLQWKMWTFTVNTLHQLSFLMVLLASYVNIFFCETDGPNVNKLCMTSLLVNLIRICDFDVKAVWFTELLRFYIFVALYWSEIHDDCHWRIHSYFDLKSSVFHLLWHNKVWTFFIILQCISNTIDFILI